MSNLQRTWTETELLESHATVTPLVAAGRRCHGGYDADGAYRSPRTRFRQPAIEAWQQAHRDDFGTEIVVAPLDTWPDSFPNVAQAKLLLRHGVTAPVATTLTRIGTVEGFGGMIRYAAVPDRQRFFDESIEGTALAHLDGGLFEAHARDEAGWADEAGHKEMWFAARDIAFEDPPTDDETRVMLERMGLPAPGAPPPSAEAIRERNEAARLVDDVPADLQMMIQRMVSLLFIEVSAFHTFAWAEAVLSDDALVAGDGEAARIVSHIRADETPHVEYLKTVITEMRDRTFVGESGRRIPGTDVVVPIWDRQLAESLGVRRTEGRRVALAEVEHALAGRPDRDDLLEEFHSLSTDREPGA